MNNAGFLSIESVRENQLANLSKQIDNLKEENDRLNNIIDELIKKLDNKENIIKEVREYIKQFVVEQKNFYPYFDLRYFDLDKVLEILDEEK